MKNLWNLQLQRETSTQQSYRPFRIMEDMQKSIEYFNKTNINSPKFGYSSINLTWKTTQKTEGSNQNFRNGYSERNSVDKKHQKISNEQSKQQCQSLQLRKKIPRQSKKMTWTQFQEISQKDQKQNSKPSKTFSIRQIKGVVFKSKKLSTVKVAVKYQP